MGGRDKPGHDGLRNACARYGGRRPVRYVSLNAWPAAAPKPSRGPTSRTRSDTKGRGFDAGGTNSSPGFAAAKIPKLRTRAPHFSHLQAPPSRAPCRHGRRPEMSQRPPHSVLGQANEICPFERTSADRDADRLRRPRPRVTPDLDAGRNPRSPTSPSLVLGPSAPRIFADWPAAPGGGPTRGWLAWPDRTPIRTGCDPALPSGAAPARPIGRSGQPPPAPSLLQ